LFTHRQKRKEKGKGAKKEEEKAAPKEKRENKEKKERKKEIQQCLHPLCPYAVLYCCLIELGPRRV